MTNGLSQCHSAQWQSIKNFCSVAKLIMLWVNYSLQVTKKVAFE